MFPKKASSLPVFLRKILRTVERHDMLQNGDAVLVGVSGGPDSMALLHGLFELSRVLDIRIGVAHLNHGLRGRESDRDAAFTQAEARRHGVPFYGAKADVMGERAKTGASIEEAARDARYRFFHRIRREAGFDKIALGHHLDDNAELILMNLLRGSGPGGISGIPPVRGPIIRPLMGVYRSEILAFLKKEAISYVLDASNADPRFLRNKIRHELIPLLKTGYNPGIVQGLNRLGNIRRAEECWMEECLASLYDGVVLQKSKTETVLSVSALQKLHPAARSRIIRRAVSEIKGNLRRISWAHLSAIQDCLEPPFPIGKPPLRLDLPDRIQVFRDAQRLVVSQGAHPSRQTKFSGNGEGFLNFAYVFSAQDIRSQPQVDLPEIHGQMRFSILRREAIGREAIVNSAPTVAFFDWDRLNFPIKIRNVRPGDRFAPLGAGGAQKLKKFFIDHKIPVSERHRVLLLIGGDIILWVGGHRISESAKLTPETTTILRAEILPFLPEA